MPATLPQVFALDGVDHYSAPILARDISFAITNIRSFRPQNQVAEKMPVYMGWWNEGTVTPSIKEQSIDIDLTTITDDCDAAEVSSTATTCDYIAPGMAIVNLKTKPLKIHDIMKSMVGVRQRNIDPTTLGQQVWDANGNFKIGNPYGQHLWKKTLADLKHSMEVFFTTHAQTGDESAHPFYVDGLYTQLDGGWLAGSVDCGQEFNIAQNINWYWLTDAAAVDANDVSGFSGPDATVLPGKTVTIHGVTHDVREGINFAEFLDEYWIEYIHVNHTSPYGEVNWEMHIKYGEKRRMRETVTCMQPCGNDSNFDSGVRSRWKDYEKRDIMTLEPSGYEFAMCQNPELADGVAYFGPRSIGGEYTYGLFFQAINQYYVDSLRGHNMYATSEGLPSETDPFVWEDESLIKTQFEGAAFRFNVTEPSPYCIQGWAQFQYGVLVSQRHLWLKVSGLSAQATFITDPGTSLTVTS